MDLLADSTELAEQILRRLLDGLSEPLLEAVVPIDAEGPLDARNAKAPRCCAQLVRGLALFSAPRSLLRLERAIADV